MVLQLFSRKRQTGLFVSLAFVMASCGRGELASPKRDSGSKSHSREFQVPEGCPKPDATHRYVEALIEPGNPRGGTFHVYVELNKDFDPKLPTVLLTNDAQGTGVVREFPDKEKARIKAKLNFMAVEHRGFPCSPIGKDIVPVGDHDAAWRVYSSWNVVEDLEAARRVVLGVDSSVMIQGSSGNGIMGFQYLSRYGANVKRAFLSSSAPSVLDMAEFENENLDELFERAGTSRSEIQSIAQKHGFDTRRIFWVINKTFQEFLPTEPRVKEFVSGLRTSPETTLRKMEEELTILDASSLMQAIESFPPIAVRFREMFGRGDEKLSEKSLIGAFLFSSVTKVFSQLIEAGKLSARTIDVKNDLKPLKTEIFLLSPRWDPSVPYRSLRKAVLDNPKIHSVVVDDTHIFAKNKKCFLSLMEEFLAKGGEFPKKYIEKHCSLAKVD